MNDAMSIFFMGICIVALILIVLYQQICFRHGIQKELKKISKKLADILDTDSDEKLMVFTDNKVLMELSAQVNRLLEERQKIRADFRRSEISSKKMLSNISHDIKTPMTVILGYLEMIRLHSSEEQKELLKVEQKARQVLGLINEFFTLAKLEAGDMELEISKVDISEICRESVLGFYELLLQQDFQVEIQIPEKKVFASGNKDALERIMFNLISNVIRYGADGKYLEVAIKEDMNFVYIDVTDHGKGIDTLFAKTVFDRLFTMEDSRNREIQGNGLGLTIAKNLAVQQEGDILLESEPNVKTTFTVLLKQVLY